MRLLMRCDDGAGGRHMGLVGCVGVCVCRQTSPSSLCHATLFHCCWALLAATQLNHPVTQPTHSAYVCAHLCLRPTHTHTQTTYQTRKHVSKPNARKTAIASQVVSSSGSLCCVLPRRHATSTHTHTSHIHTRTYEAASYKMFYVCAFVNVCRTTTTTQHTISTDSCSFGFPVEHKHRRCVLLPANGPSVCLRVCLCRLRLLTHARPV